MYLLFARHLPRYFAAPMLKDLHVHSPTLPGMCLTIKKKKAQVAEGIIIKNTL
jgi:hypothetical protein